jgi:hypothetical protein
LRTNIAERCQSVNKKKAALDAKLDTSASTRQLLLLEKDLEDLEAKVWATKQRIQEEKDLISSSKQEAQALTAELKVDLDELSALSKQVTPGVDEEDEAVIAEVDRVRLDAIAAIGVPSEIPFQINFVCVYILTLKSMVTHRLFSDPIMLTTSKNSRVDCLTSAVLTILRSGFL